MDTAGRSESKEVLGYSAFDLAEECYEYNENACYIADDATTLRKFLSNAMLDVHNYRCDPVTIEDMQRDFGCSYGEFALEPRALERFKRIAQALGIKYVVEAYETVFDTQDDLFIVTLTRSGPIEDKPIRFYDDDGTEINPDLISKPSLCTSCEKDDDPSEEPLCALNRLDQQGEEEFRCDAYVGKDME